MTDTFARIIGVDYGSKRIGLSISDPLGIIARPIDALPNSENMFTALRTLAEREQIKLFVVGMPFNLKGQAAYKAEEVQGFIDRLKQETGLEIVPWDERFTTTMAHQTLRDMGTKKSERQKKDGRIDSMAAALLLQNYLDSTKKSRSC
jgi:putative Holliday junction resolvase